MVSLIQADAERIPLADNSVDLVLGSPPYLECRDYGIGASRPLDTWVPWMLKITKEAVRVSRGLVIWVMAGQTKNGYYQPGPEALLYEWYKTGGVCWNPMFWHRHGIPGSGGKQKLKNNIEYVFGFTKHKKLPWSDNLACGTPPKYKTGGRYLHRTQDGTRVCRERKEIKLCNPGNVFFTELTAEQIWSTILSYANATKANPGQVLQALQFALEEGRLPGWLVGVHYSILGSKILQPHMQGYGRKTASDMVPWVPEGVPPKNDYDYLLFKELQDGLFEDGREDGQADAGEGCGKACGQGTFTENKVLGVRKGGENSDTPHRRKSNKQQPRELGCSLPVVSPKEAQEATSGLSDLWSYGEAVQDLWGLVQQALRPIQEAWRSVSEGSRLSQISNLSDGLGLIRAQVGGNKMGSEWASQNEAPYPEKLCEPIIKTYCPPGGVCYDPFMGSGTTVAVALKLGRNAIGSDIRMSELVKTHCRIDGISVADYKLGHRPIFDMLGG